MVVVGTGTGVGKTHVGCALVEAWCARGQRAVGLKPVESGVGGPDEAARGAGVSDQERLTDAGRVFHVKREVRPVARALYAFLDPISPHLAAKRAGVRIELAAIVRWVDENAGSITLVETPGGLFSPLDTDLTNLDLVRALQPALLLLVAPDRLGVLHDVTTTTGLAAARDLPIDALALSTPSIPDASTGGNAIELAALRIAFPLAVFPRAPPADPESRLATESVIRWTTSAPVWG